MSVENLFLAADAFLNIRWVRGGFVFALVWMAVVMWHNYSWPKVQAVLEDRSQSEFWKAYTGLGVFLGYLLVAFLLAVAWSD